MTTLADTHNHRLQLTRLLEAYDMRVQGMIDAACLQPPDPAQASEDALLAHELLCEMAVLLTALKGDLASFCAVYVGREGRNGKRA